MLRLTTMSKRAQRKRAERKIRGLLLTKRTIKLHLVSLRTVRKLDVEKRTKPVVLARRKRESVVTVN